VGKLRFEVTEAYPTTFSGRINEGKEHTAGITKPVVCLMRCISPVKAHTLFRPYYVLEF